MVKDTKYDLDAECSVMSARSLRLNDSVVRTGGSEGGTSYLRANHILICFSFIHFIHLVPRN